MKKAILIKNSILLIFITVLFINCSSNNDDPKSETNSEILLTTSPVTNITSSSAICGGMIVSVYNNITITQKGVVWSTTPKPTIILTSKTIENIDSPNFTSNLSELAPKTTYYIRAYAKNQFGTFYGNEITFTSGVVNIPNTLPTLNTLPVESITIFNASCGGTISSNGGSPIIACGVCCGQTPNPTIDLNINLKTNDINNISNETFKSNITDLQPETTYYVRAYATNSLGTGYGSSITFTTKPLEIGMNYQGGKIFYILKSGDIGYDAGKRHGLIVSLDDLSSNSTWANQTYIGLQVLNTYSEIGTGFSNTNNIITMMGGLDGLFAAKTCANYYNYTTAWYLPSSGELHELCKYYQKEGIVNNVTYWSSTYYGSFHFPITINMTNNTENEENMWNQHNVCAVHSF